MYSMAMIWDYFIINHSLNLVIHILRCFEPLSRFQAIPNPIKLSLIFWVFSPTYPNSHRITIHDILNPRNMSLCLIKYLPIDSSP